MREEDALLYIIELVREKSPNQYSKYGYDVYLPTVLNSYLQSIDPNIDSNAVYNKQRELSPLFLSAAWDLCRRGILRPGVKIFGEQDTSDGSAGNGYSITPFGRQWIKESERDTFVPTEPGRFAEMLHPFKERFGPGFYMRAQEAIRCYGAHAYLASCAMCGAAAESILLATAIAKEGDETKVLNIYRAASGRTRVENAVIGKAREQLKREFLGLTALLKYWRDEASHGLATQITDNEAYTSLAMLLRYAITVNDSWTDLTGRSS